MKQIVTNNAYISHTFVPFGRSRNLFKYHLLFYDKFYSFGEIESIPYQAALDYFNKQKRSTVDPRITSHERKMFKYGMSPVKFTDPKNMVTTLLYLFNDDFNAYKLFKPFYTNLYKTDNLEFRKFIDNFSAAEKSLGKGEFYPFSIDALNICSETFFDDPNKWHNGEVVHRDWVLTPFHSIMWGLISKYHLNCDLIFTPDDWDVLTALSLNKWEGNDLMNGAERYKDYFLDYLNNDTNNFIENKISIAEVIVPEMENIPYSEILKLKSSKSFIPLSQYIADLVERDLSKEDLLKYLMEQLWKITSTITPSLSEITIGVIGNLPVGPINPVGIYSVAKQGKNMLDLKNNYPWYFAVRDLKRCRQELNSNIA